LNQTIFQNIEQHLPLNKSTPQYESSDKVQLRCLPQGPPEIFTLDTALAREESCLFSRPSLKLARFSAADYLPHLSTKDDISKEHIAVLRRQSI
jgi:hypothetical protein